MAAIGPDEIKSLEQIRQRLQTLNSSLNALLANFHETQTLPAWASLQLHSGLITNNLQTLVQQLAENQQLLSAMVAYPLPQYPSAQAALLEHLLRTRPEPEVQEWIKNGQDMAQDTSQARSVGISETDRDMLWQWAPIAANDEIRKQNWGGDYTMAEKQSGIENINTGLSRELHEPPDPDEQDDGDGLDQSDDEEDGEDERDEDEVVQTRRKPNIPGLEIDPPIMQRPPPQIPIEKIFRFTSTGSTS